jgi:hypothetical protein
MIPTICIGCPVRDKNGRKGTIIADDKSNTLHRYLTIRFEDGAIYGLKLNNNRKDDPDPLEIEWERDIGQWTRIASDK